MKNKLLLFLTMLPMISFGMERDQISHTQISDGLIKSNTNELYVDRAIVAKRIKNILSEYQGHQKITLKQDNNELKALTKGELIEYIFNSIPCYPPDEGNASRNFENYLHSISEKQRYYLAYSKLAKKLQQLQWQQPSQFVVSDYILGDQPYLTLEQIVENQNEIKITQDKPEPIRHCLGLDNNTLNSITFLATTINQCITTASKSIKECVYIVCFTYLIQHFLSADLLKLLLSRSSK